MDSLSHMVLCIIPNPLPNYKRSDSGEKGFLTLAVSTSADVPVRKERHRAGVVITYVPATYFLGVPPGSVTTADVFAGIVKTHFHSSPS